MNVDRYYEDIIALQETTERDATHNHNNKRKPDGQLKEPEKNKNSVIFPAFDLSTKRIGFGNGTHRVTTVAYELKCHPDHSPILKYILIKSSVLDPFHHPTQKFKIQSTDATTVKNQLIQQNCFLAQTSIVPIFNINEDSMNSETNNGIKNDSLSYYQ